MRSFPLTEAQQGLWAAKRLDPANPVQNTARLVVMRGPLDAEVFRGAADQALGEADGFAVRLRESGAGPRIERDGIPAPALEIVDVSGRQRPEATVRRWIRRDMARPRDPSTDPLVTARLFRVHEDLHLWYQCIQHLVVDWYGTSLLDTRILDLYGSRVSGAGEATRPFASFDRVLEEDADYRASERREADRAFWADYLDGMGSVRGLAKGVPLSAAYVLRERVALPPEVMLGLQEVAAGAATGWPDAAVGLVGVYLARHLREREVVVGVPTMNRMGSAAATVPATVMNVLPVRVPVDEDRSAAALVEELAASLRQVRRHGRYRGEQIRRDRGLLGEDRRLYGPLVNVLPPQALPAPDGISLEVETLNAGPVDDLTFAFRSDAAGRTTYLEVEANPDLYTQDEVRAHARRLSRFLERARGAPTLASIPTLSDDEARRWIVDVNDTKHPVADETLVDLFEASFRARADATALTGPDGTLTYRELDRLTAQVAAELRGRGVRSGSTVGVLLPRSVARVVAMIGVMRAGAAYLPLDPDHPDARIHQLLELAGSDVVITTAGLGSAVPEPLRMVLGDAWLDVADPAPAPRGPRPDVAPAPPRPRPEDAAYVIFTSGSTGTPKGVVVEHRAIVNRLQWMRTRFDFGPEDRILQKTPATFDVSVWELFLPFIAGATMVVAPPGVHREPSRLARLVRDEGVTTMHFVPSMFGPFLDDPGSEGLAVRRVFTSGEALPAALRDRFHRRMVGELHNLYGPTEAAVDVTHWPAGPDDRSDPVPIGRPVWNTRMYVLDDRLRPVPAGVLGELYIAGVQLARGYLGRSDLTARSFVPDPWGGEGARMYRTGDLALWRDDGSLEFAGRIDHQVKLRGQRVELGEIESVLMDVDGVGEAVVFVREDRPGVQRLTGYVTAVGERPPDEAELRRELGRRLPEVMVPADILVLEEFPLTSNGKLDRSALPRPALRTGSSVPPASPIEAAVADIFREVLGIEGVLGADADFFLLGGHSLMAVHLARALGDRFGVRPDLGTLFSHPTVGRLAEHLERAIDHASPSARDGNGGLEPLLNLLPQVAEAGVPPLYCVHPAGGIGWCYGALARSLDPPRPVYALQADGLDPDVELPGSLEELASRYVARILEVHPDGPVHLAGWSVGGIIAHEMACQLRAAGEEVGIVALLDAYPADRWRDEPEPTEADALRALLLIAGEDPDQTDPKDLTRGRVRERLHARDHPLAALSDRALDGVVRVVESNARLVRLHRHGIHDGAVLHFRAGLDHHDEPELTPDLWRSYAREVKAYRVESLHAHMTGPSASRAVADELDRHLRRADPAMALP